MGPEIAPSPPPTPPAPPPPRRLTRSSREKMWAGVAGGMAEYFDLDPSLMRLIWVAAAVVSQGLAIPLYILAWIILPRDDRATDTGHPRWRDWSQEFHAETQRLAEEARRTASEFRGTAESEVPAAGPPAHPPVPEVPPAPPRTEPEYAWSTELEEHRPRGGSPRGVGVALVALGAFMLANNWGWFAWFNWSTMWPLIFIGVGVFLLARQINWSR